MRTSLSVADGIDPAPGRTWMYSIGVTHPVAPVPIDRNLVPRPPRLSVPSYAVELTDCFHDAKL